MTNLEIRYLNQPIEEFLANGGDTTEYARLVFAGEIFGPGQDVTDTELGIHTEQDLANALENLTETLTATAINDATTILITDASGAEILDIPVGLISEDAAEWEREVDEHLASEGFTRTGPWHASTAPVARRK